MKQILCLLTFAFFLCSCSSSKKFKSKETEIKKSSEILTSNIVDVNSVDSSSIIYDDSSFTNHSSIKIEFDNNFDLENPTDFDPAESTASLAPDRSKDLENDYEGAEPKKQKPVVGKTSTIDFSYNINGNIITSSVPIKNISLVDDKTGQVTALEIKKNITHDSSAATSSAVTQTSSERTTTTKEKKVTSWWWLGLVLLLCLVMWFVYQIPVVKMAVNTFLRPLFAIFKRKKKQDPPNT